MLTPMRLTVVSSWLDVLRVVDHSWVTQETVEREKPSSVAVLDTLKPVHLAPTTIPNSMALKYFVLPFHPLNDTHTQFMYQLSQGLNNLSLTFIYTDWSGFNRWHHLDSPGQVMSVYHTSYTMWIGTLLYCSAGIPKLGGTPNKNVIHIKK